jgi:hypothetical protein
MGHAMRQILIASMILIYTQTTHAQNNVLDDAADLLPPEVIKLLPSDGKKIIKERIEELPIELRQSSTVFCADGADDARMIAGWKAEGKTMQESEKLYIKLIHRKEQLRIPIFDKNMIPFEKYRRSLLDRARKTVSGVYDFSGSQEQVHNVTYRGCLFGMLGIELRGLLGQSILTGDYTQLIEILRLMRR